MASLDKPVLVFRNVTKAYPPNSSAEGLLALYDVSLTLRDGEFVSLIGPSGCGKSTLLNIAAGLLNKTSGEALCLGKPINGINTDVGYLTQHSNLLPWRTVGKNAGIALEIQGMSKAERTERVNAVLKLVGIDQFARHYPSQLSGGMQRRLALARMLVYEPEILLMDEPFGALDAQLRMELQRELLRIWERDTKTVLFVTHDLEEAILLSDRVVVLGTGPGRIVHEEQIDFERPRNLNELRLTDQYRQIWSRLWKFLEPLAQQPEFHP